MFLTRKRKPAGAVPVIPSLAERLNKYRAHLGKPSSGPMFPGKRLKKALSPNNVFNREIKPVLNRCVECGKAKAEHIQAEVDHKYRLDERLPRWQGWHAFRRGLATNMHDLGVDDETIQAILRHSQRCRDPEVLHQISPQAIADRHGAV